MQHVRMATMLVLGLVSLLPVKSLAQSPGSSYVYIIPFVTTENNSRSNLGLNGYILDSIVKGVNPSANVLVQLYDPQGKLAGSGNYVVQPNQLVQVNNQLDILSPYNLQ